MDRGRKRTRRREELLISFCAFGSGLVGKLTVCVDSVHEWDKEGLMGAYAKLQTGKVKGKVVVRVGGAGEGGGD